MSISGTPLTGAWAEDARDLLSASTDNGSPVNGNHRRPPSDTFTATASAATAVDDDSTPYGVSRQQLEALSAMAYLVGSPLQRQQPRGGSEATHPALLVAAKLLQQGVDPERVIQLIECRYDLPAGH